MKKEYSPIRMTAFYTTLTIIFVFLVISNGFSQTFVNESWQNQEGQPSPTVNWSKTVTHADGDVFVVGNTQHATQGTNIFIVKYDNNGVKEWERQFNGTSSGNDFGTGIIVDAVQNIYVIGTVFNAQDLSNDYAVLRYNNHGILQWQYIYDAYHKDDIPTDIAFTPDGDLLITGSSEGNSTQRDYLTLKLDDGGNLLWQKRYDYAQLDDGAVAIEVLSSSKYVITGASQSSPASNEVATITYNANGNIMGIERQSGVVINTVEDITTDDLGNIYLTGYADNANGDLDYKTVKMDSDLVVTWTKTHNEANAMDKAQALVVDASYNVYVTGTIINGAGVSQLKTIKYNVSGNIIWQRNFSTSNTSAFFDHVDMVQNGNGELGITATIAGNETNVHTMAYGTDGDSKWSKTFSIIGNEKPSEITPTNNGFNVTGISGNSTKEYFVISYSTFDRLLTPKLGSNGLPEYVQNEVVVDFSSEEINTTNTDDDKIGYGTLETFFKPALVSEINTLLGEVVNTNDIRVTRVFKRLKTSQKICVTREGNEIIIPSFWSTFVLHLPNGVNEQTVANALSSSSKVNTAALNTYAELSSTPNDSWYGSQHSLKSTTYNNGDINVEGAWDIATGEEFVKVGVVDVGINYKHEDFDVNGSSRVVGGFQYDVHKAYNSNSYIWDGTGHGTKVAGIIGANRGNTTGIAGIAGGGNNLGNGVSLYNIAIGTISSTGQSSIILANIIAGIVDAATSEGVPTNSAYGEGFGLHIMNHSYGTWAANYMNDPSLILEEKAIRFAFRSGVISVAARGNTISNTSSFPQYPACFDDHLIINVGGSNKDGVWWDDPANNTGAAIGHGIDIAGPAQEYDGSTPLIFSTGANDVNLLIDAYLPFGATSAAAPHIAGTVALMLSHVNQDGCISNLSVEDVEYLLEHNAMFKQSNSNSPTAPDEYTGYGLIDATATLEAMEMPKYRIKHFSSTYDLNAVKISPQESGWTNRKFDVSHGSFRDFTAGTYPSKWYKIAPAKFFAIDPTETILDTWPRISSTNMYPTIVSAGGSVYNTYGASNYNFNPNQPSVAMEGYAYKIDLGSGNYTWFPEELNHGLPLTVSFSVYTKDDNASTYSYPCTPPLGVHKVELLESDASLYPNPSSVNYTGLKYSLNANSLIRVMLYDNTGRHIKTILKENQSVGSHFVKIALNGLTNGIYFIKLETESGSITQKLIKTK